MSQQVIQSRLKDLGIALPTPAAPAANYVPFVISGTTLHVSGQLPAKDGTLIKGCLGREIGIEQGQEAAKLCAVNILAQANAALEGNLGRIRRCVKLGGFVASAPDFFDQPKVVNGASDLIVAVLGDAGRHARFAVGVAALPFGVAVEVDATFEIAS
ncbi:MAG: RidA family protein [Alphaproteobacteria bacterium]|nr:RidA family protein [Alphaproteobacteria bacterium]MDE2336331.1 RidA family protein [Alphaproteobacteria bacterium]